MRNSNLLGTHIPIDYPPLIHPPDLKPSKNMADLIITDKNPLLFEFLLAQVVPCVKERFVYLWLKNDKEFWAWIQYLDTKNIGGWTWTGTRWGTFETSLDEVVAFYCNYPK